MDSKIIFYTVCGIAIIAMLIYYIKRKNRLTSFIFGGLSGFVALLLMNRYGEFLGVTPPLNAFNTVGSLVLGVPYVVTIILIEKLL